MRAPVGSASVTEFVDRGKEDIRGDIHAAVGKEFHFLVRVSKQVLADRDLAGQVGDPPSKGGVEMDVAAQGAQELFA